MGFPSMLIHTLPMSSLLLFAGSVSNHLRFYRRYFADRWDAMTPMEYGTLLIIIAVVGWLLMKGTGRR